MSVDGNTEFTEISRSLFTTSLSPCSAPQAMRGKVEKRMRPVSGLRGDQNGAMAAKPGKLLPADGAKKRNASPVNGSASAAEVGITTVAHVGL